MNNSRLDEDEILCDVCHELVDVLNVSTNNHITICNTCEFEIASSLDEIATEEYNKMEIVRGLRR